MMKKLGRSLIFRMRLGPIARPGFFSIGPRLVIELMEVLMEFDGLDGVITVKSANVDLGQALPQHVRESVLRITAKYFGELVAAPVYFSREGPLFRCAVNLQIGSFKMISAGGLGADCYQAFNVAIEKAAKQLRRKKRAIRDNRARRPSRTTIPFADARL
jgi:ribosomal subunit interface protein